MNTLVIAAVIAAPPPADALKCGRLPNTFPGYDPAAPVVVVDDRVLSGSEGLQAIGSVDVARLEVSCWNPDTGEIGVAPAIPLVRVVTEGWCERVPVRPGDDVGGSVEEVCDWREAEQRAALREAYGAPSARAEPDRPADRIADLRRLGPNDEFGPYSVILREVAARVGEWSYLVVRPSVPATRLTDPILAVVREEAGAEATFAVADEGDRRLGPEDAERLGVELFDPERISRAQAANEGLGFWQAAARTYPAGLRLVRLGRPAFSPDGARAVVYYGWNCGGRCGETRLALLSRASGEWAVVHDHPMVIY